MENKAFERLKRYFGAGIRAFLLEGPAGVGKTSVTARFAEAVGAQYFFIQCWPGMRYNDLVFDIYPSDSNDSGVELKAGILVKAVISSLKGLVVVAIDEFDKTLASADAFLLDFLQNTRVTFKNELLQGIRSNIVVFLTSNGVREFSEPLMRRVVRIRMQHPSESEVADVLRGYGIPDDFAVVLAKIHALTVARDLRKPATIQELVEFYKAIQAGVDVSEAVEEILIKYDDDIDVVSEIVSIVRSNRRGVVRSDVVKRSNRDSSVVCGDDVGSSDVVFEEKDLLDNIINHSAFRHVTDAKLNAPTFDCGHNTFFVVKSERDTLMNVIGCINYNFPPTDDPARKIGLTMKQIDGKLVVIPETLDALATFINSMSDEYNFEEIYIHEVIVAPNNDAMQRLLDRWEGYCVAYKTTNRTVYIAINEDKNGVGVELVRLDVDAAAMAITFDYVVKTAKNFNTAFYYNVSKSFRDASYDGWCMKK